MNDVELLWRLAANGIRLRAGPNRSLEYEADRGALTPELREMIVRNRMSLVRALSTDDGSAPTSFVAVTPLQAQYFTLSDKGPRWVKNSVAVRLNAPLAESRLDQAIRLVARRHPLLRSEFREMDGRLACGIRSNVDVSLSVHSVDQLPADLDVLFNQDRDFAFNPGHPPLWRVQVFNQSPGSVVLLTMHHLISDGWSMHLLLEELLLLYQGEEEARLGEPGDFGAWASQVPRPVHGAGLSTRASSLVIDSGPTSVTRSRAAFTQSELMELARVHRATPFLLLLGAFVTALSSITNKRNLTIAVPVSLRDEYAHERILGPLVRTAAIDFELEDGAGDPDLALRAVAQARDVVSRNSGGLPVIEGPDALQIRFNFLDFHSRSGPNKEIHVESGEIAGGMQGRFKLKLYIWYDGGEGVILKFVYARRVFEPSAIEAIRDHLEQVLRDLAPALLKGGT